MSSYERLGIDPVTIGIGITVAAKLADYWIKRHGELEAEKITAKTAAEKEKIQRLIDEAQRQIDHYTQLMKQEERKQSGIKLTTALSVGIPALLGVFLLTR